MRRTEYASDEAQSVGDAAMRSSTHTLIGALQVISRDLNTEDGVMEGAIDEAAIRLQELDAEVTQLRLQLERFERKDKKTGTGGVG